MLIQRGIKLKPRPSRRHNKVEVIERKNGTIKRIVEKLQLDKSATEDGHSIIQKIPFLSNVFSGSSILSAFELARGYQPSILGTGSKAAGKDIIRAHLRQAAVRALHRLLRSRHPKISDKTAIKAGEDILYFYNSSKQNESKEWRTGVVKTVHDHYVEIQSHKKGPPTRAAFEDIRIPPKEPLAEALMDYPVDEIEYEGENSHRNCDNQEDHNSIAQHHDLSQILESLRSKGPSEEEKCTGEAMLAKLSNDVQTYDHSEFELSGHTLQSNEKAILNGIYSKIGPAQVT